MATEDGTKFKSKQLANMWSYERKTNPVLKPERRSRAPRAAASAVVRLRRAGASEGEIAAIVGRSEGMVKRYCRLPDQKVNAIAAVHRPIERERNETSRTLKKKVSNPLTFLNSDISR